MLANYAQNTSPEHSLEFEAHDHEWPPGGQTFDRLVGPKEMQ